MIAWLEKLWAWIVSLFRSDVRPVRAFSFQWMHRTITAEGIMERIRFFWAPSPDTFVEKHRLTGTIDGQPFTGPDLPANALETSYDFPTGSLVEAALITFGDNGTQATSDILSFAAMNPNQVRPVVGFGWMHVEHIP